MGTWETTSTKSTFDATKPVTTTIDNRSKQRSEAANAKTGSIVGMNVNKIPGVITALDQYITNVETHLAGINALADASKAFKSSEIETSVKTYVGNVKKYCINLTTQLRAFEDKLKDAQKAWETSTKSMGTEISSEASNMAVGSNYVRKES